MDIGEAEVAALKSVSQPTMVDAKQMKDRCLEIMHMDRVRLDVVAEIIGLAVEHGHVLRPLRPSKG